MNVKTVHITRLLELLSERTGEPLDPKGFKEMSVLINEATGKQIGHKYLYENLFRGKENAIRGKQPEVNLQLSKLDVLADYLGYKHFRLLAENIEKPADEILVQCVGNYYSYVRRNSKETVLLRSPVRITQDGIKFSFELKGESSIFTGELQITEGCLFVLMTATNGKRIHHVYKIGKRIRPKVLQGIFSGVSTAFDPIGGKAVLVRMEKDFDGLKNLAMNSGLLKKSEFLHERKLVNYFKTKEANNLAINPEGMTFTDDDL